MNRFVVLVLVTFATGACARQLFVDTRHSQAGDANAGTSLTAPWKTITKAAAAAVAGDTVNIREGSYGGGISTSNSGTVTNRIMYRSYNGEQPVAASGFTIATDYVTVQGLEINGDMAMNGAYGKLLGCYQHSGSALYVHGSYNLIRGNRITDNVWDQITTGWGTAGHHCVIEYNEVYDPNAVGEDFMQYMNHDMIIRGNYFHHIGGTDRHPDCYQSGGNEYNIWMINNRFENLDNVQYYMPGSGDHDHIWRGNLFWGSVGWGLNTAGMTGLRVMNNTFSLQSGWGVREVGIALNNIFSPPGSDGHGGSSVDYNCVYPVPCCAQRGTHDLWGVDPVFVNSATRDFRLQSTSPCRDAGTYLTTATSAGGGTQIPVADAMLFIDGFGITDGDTIQLQGQTQTAKILSINYSTKVLILDRSLTWTNGLGVSVPYSGSGPDIGAFEYVPATAVAPALYRRPVAVSDRLYTVYDILGRKTGQSTGAEIRNGTAAGLYLNVAAGGGERTVSKAAVMR